MLRLAADEDLNHRITRGLRRRLPGLDLVRAQDAGLAGVDDGAVLDWAAAADRVMVTHDVNTMTAAAWQRLRAGRSFPGLFVVPQSVDIGVAIEELVVLAECSRPGEWQDRIVFLPLT